VEKKGDEPVTFESVMNEYPPVSVVMIVDGKVDDLFAKLVRALGRETFEVHGHRIRLLVGGKSRVEIFFRANGYSTLVNVFQFDVKAKEVDAAATAWHDRVLTALS
jgi:hypothetical protein